MADDRFLNTDGLTRVEMNMYQDALPKSVAWWHLHKTHDLVWKLHMLAEADKPIMIPVWRTKTQPYEFIGIPKPDDKLYGGLPIVTPFGMVQWANITPEKVYHPKYGNNQKITMVNTSNPDVDEDMAKMYDPVKCDDFIAYAKAMEDVLNSDRVRSLVEAEHVLNYFPTLKGKTVDQMYEELMDAVNSGDDKPLAWHTKAHEPRRKTFIGDYPRAKDKGWAVPAQSSKEDQVDPESKKTIAVLRKVYSEPLWKQVENLQIIDQWESALVASMVPTKQKKITLVKHKDAKGKPLSIAEAFK